MYVWVVLQNWLLLSRGHQCTKVAYLNSFMPWPMVVSAVNMKSHAQVNSLLVVCATD